MDDLGEIFRIGVVAFQGFQVQRRYRTLCFGEPTEETRSITWIGKLLCTRSVSVIMNMIVLC